MNTHNEAVLTAMVIELQVKLKAASDSNDELFRIKQRTVIANGELKKKLAYIMAAIASDAGNNAETIRQIIEGKHESKSRLAKPD